jgi:hypothetical protein
MSILVTSRLIPELASLFDGCPQLEIRAVEQDVQEYVKGHLNNFQSLPMKLKISLKCL